jgi:hypothetical protein
MIRPENEYNQAISLVNMCENGLSCQVLNTVINDHGSWRQRSYSEVTMVLGKKTSIVGTRHRKPFLFSTG